MPVHVAVGASAAQVKLLTGLPSTNDTHALAAVVREGAASFFLRNGNDLVTTGVKYAGEGRAWAAAIESATVEAIRAALRIRGVKLHSIAPAAVVLPLVARNDGFMWHDGPVTLKICRKPGAALETVRRMPSVLTGQDGTQLDPIEALASLGSEAVRYAAAIGAILIDPHTPLALGPDGVRPLSVSMPLRRLLLPGLIGGIGLAAMLLSPLGGAWIAQRSKAVINDKRDTEVWRAMEGSMAQLQQITTVLEEIESFAASRPERTQTLADLTRALPDHSAIVRLSIDESEGNLVVVTPNAAALMEALRSLPGLTAVDMVGQMARQHANGLEVDRITIRFRIDNSRRHTLDRVGSDEIP